MHSLTCLILGVAASATMFTSAIAADLNPAAVAFTLPDKIEWKQGSGRNQQAILAGDPSKPGIYVVLQKWLPHNNSHPHFHQHDRYVQVLQGTWWVQTGAKYDPAGFKPVPAGSFVVHHAKEIHYDGAKDEPCLLLISGMGPSTSVQAEEK